MSRSADASSSTARVRVQQVDTNYFEVFEGVKWWSLKRIGFDGWLIMNGRGQVVRSSGPTGKRLIQAVMAR